MRYPDAESFKGMIIWSRGGLRGPAALPGNYTATLIDKKDSLSVPFEIVKDPRSTSDMDQLKEQFDFLISTRDELTKAHKAIKQIRTIRKEIQDAAAKLKDMKDVDTVKNKSKAIVKELTSVEETLYQTKSKSNQDVLNFPIRLNDKLSSLAGDVASGDFRPTEQAYAVKKELFGKIDEQLDKLKNIIDVEVPEFNKLVKEADVPAVLVK